MKVESTTSKQQQREEMSAGQNGGAGAVVRMAKRFALPLLVFCWPLIFLFRHVFVINGKVLTIGNDFIGLYYKYKVYLLDCLANFHFPLWSPSEAAGFPFYTNPFAQVFYPFNAMLVLWYKVFGGYTWLVYVAEAHQQGHTCGAVRGSGNVGKLQDYRDYKIPQCCAFGGVVSVDTLCDYANDVQQFYERNG
jgi:hypothetical protein